MCTGQGPRMRWVAARSMGWWRRDPAYQPLTELSACTYMTLSARKHRARRCGHPSMLHARTTTRATLATRRSGGRVAGAHLRAEEATPGGCSRSNFLIPEYLANTRRRVKSENGCGMCTWKCSVVSDCAAGTPATVFNRPACSRAACVLACTSHAGSSSPSESSQLGRIAFLLGVVADRLLDLDR